MARMSKGEASNAKSNATSHGQVDDFLRPRIARLNFSAYSAEFFSLDSVIGTPSLLNGGKHYSYKLHGMLVD